MKKIHIIGIAGVGMSATALLLKEAGWQVSGSDDPGVYGPPVGILEKAGIPFARGYSPENIPADTDCFLIGRNAKLAPSENKEVAAALASGSRVYSFPEMLAELIKGRENLVVAGSYGKSTTASLVAHILRHAGVDAGYFIGAEPVATRWLPAPASIGTAPTFVLEGDEYPSAHDDPRAKFLHLHPKDVLLTSVVHDHVNVYPTMADYEKPFRELLALIPGPPAGGGLAVVCADEHTALWMAESMGVPRITYGIEAADADFRAESVEYGERSRFSLWHGEVELGEMETPLLGAHNIQNIVGAAAWVLTRELATFEAVAAAVASFPGVRRRLDNIAPHSRVPMLEGFGSSYEKARAAIEAVHLHFSDKSLVIVFEPHTFSWRNRASLPWYDDIFKEAAKVFILPPEEQGAATHEQLSHDEILKRVGSTAEPYGGPEATAAALTGDEVLLVLTSGDLEGTLDTLIEQVSKHFPSGHT